MSKRARRRLMMLGLGVVSVVGGVIGVHEMRAHQHRHLVATAREEGVAAYDGGDLEAALERLSYYVQQKKDEIEVVDALLKFADARRRVPLPAGRHLIEATGLYQHARRLLTDHPGVAQRERRLIETDRRLLALYGAQGMGAELVDTAARLLERAPGDREALAALAQVRCEQREFAGAGTCIDRLIALEPEDLEWRHLKLRVMRGMKRSDADLLAQCDAWMEAWDGDGRMAMLKAGWLADMGRLQAARGAAEAAAEAGAADVEVLKQMVALLDALERTELASDLLEEAEGQFSEGQWVAGAKVERLWHAGELDAARREIQRVEARDDRLESALLRLKAVICLSASDSQGARAALDSLSKRSDDDEDGRADRLWARAVAARLDLTSASWGKAVAAIEAALAVQPDDAVLQYMLGEACEVVGERAAAADAFQRAFERAPRWLAAGVRYGDALLALGRAPEALRVSRALLSRATEQRLAVYLIAARASLAQQEAGGSAVLTDRETGTVIDVARVLETIARQYPQRSDVASLLVDAYCVTDRRDDAMNYTRRLAADDDAAIDVLLAAAGAARRHGLDSAGALVDEARQRDGVTLTVAIAQADLLADAQRFDEGLALIDEAIAAAPAEVRMSPAARQARCAHLLRMNRADAMIQLRALVREFHGEADVQRFALAQPAAWDDRGLIAQVIENLRAVVGDRAAQVMLAEANLLLRYESQDEAQRAQAMVLIDDVLRQSPDSVPALLLMAEAALAGERPSVDRAVDALQRAVHLTPSRSELYERLIPLLERKGDYAGADQYLRQLSRLARRDEAARGREIRLLQQRGDFEAALLCAMRTVHAQSPVRDQLTLAVLHVQAGATAEAEQIYRRLLGTSAGEPLVITQAAEFYARTGRLDEALALLESESARCLAPAARAATRARLHYGYGDGGAAEAAYRQAIRLEPDSIAHREHLTNFYLAAGRFPEACNTALAGLELAPENRSLRSAVAMAGLALGPDAPGLPAHLLDDLDADDSLGATLALLGSLPKQGGALVATEEGLGQAMTLLEAHPRFLPAWQLAITLHHLAGRQREAIELARRAISRFPAEAAPCQWACRMLMESSRFDEALVEAREWRRRGRGDVLDVDTVIASILIELDRPADARRHLDGSLPRLLAERSVAAERLEIWFRAAVLAGEIEATWRTVQPICAEDARWGEAWLATAALVDEAEAVDVISRYETEIAGKQDDLAASQTARAWCGLGWRFDRPEHLRRAEQLAREEPMDAALRPAWRFLRGRIAEGLGDLAAAERWYRGVLETEPENPWALNNLAFLLAQRSGRSAQAIEYAEKALALEPDHPDLLATRARALAAAGRSAEARSALVRAIELRPDDPALRMAQAELLLDQGRHVEARDALRRAEEGYRGLPAAVPALEERIVEARRRLEQAHAAVKP